MSKLTLHLGPALARCARHLGAAGFLALTALPGSAVAAPKAADLVRAELVAEPRAVAPGQRFTVAVRLAMVEGWHTYWRNPGDSGLATEIAWELPSGFSAGPIQWPTPERIPVSHLVNYGYEGDATLLVDVTAPETLPRSGPVELKGLVSYLVCKKECIPGEARVSTVLPVAAGPGQAELDPAVAYIFTAARERLPERVDWPVSVQGDGERLELRVRAAGIAPATVRSGYFFSADETAVDHAAPQVVSAGLDGLALTLKRSAAASAIPAQLPGVLVLDQDGTGQRAYAIGPEPAPPTQVASGVGPGTPASVLTPVAWLDLARTALLAFVGGLILNLMPCVFPVLSIKILSLARHGSGGPAGMRKAGLAYTAGVVAAFLSLAAVLLAIRTGGQEIGWGFQLQSPAVVAGLAFLLLAVGLNLSGVFEIGTRVASAAGGAAHRDGAAGSFATGVLAAAVAAPCTAPFMGAAIGYGLTAPAPVALAVFVALALGMAAPFLLLSLRPSLLAWLPRPGRWMEVLKQVLAFPVYATVAWLLFVLSQQVGPVDLFAVLLGLVLVGFAAWCWQASAGSGGGISWAGRGAALASLAALALIGGNLGPGGARSGSADLASIQAGGAEPFSQVRLDALRAEGRPVFVNMTAAWCISCIVNEKVVLSSEPVQAKLRDGKVAYLKGDWTSRNPEITRLLERYGRSGVPFYAVFPGRGEPTILPEILTEATVINSLTAAAARSQPPTTRLSQGGESR